MTRRHTTPKRSVGPVLPRPSTTWSQPGVYRPPNRWRSQTGSHLLQRAQHLASLLPRLTKYNHTRS